MADDLRAPSINVPSPTMTAAQRTANHVMEMIDAIAGRSIVSSMAIFDTILGWLVSVVGVATGIAYVPQAARIWKRRSSDDVSILTYALFLGGQLVYLVYGIRIAQWPLIIGM